MKKDYRSLMILILMLGIMLTGCSSNALQKDNKFLMCKIKDKKLVERLLK